MRNLINISYFQIIASNKGYKFIIDEPTTEPAKKQKKENFKINCILDADNITKCKYMELLEMRQKQPTNINDNFMIDKYYYKKLFHFLINFFHRFLL